MSRVTRRYPGYARSHRPRGLTVLILVAAPLLLARAAGGAYFSPKVDYGSTTGPYAVAVGDLNNDQIPDLVMTHDPTDSISVYFGIGDGTFGPRKTSWVVIAADDLAIGNFNGDQWADVALLEFGGLVRVCLGDGSGLFTNFLIADSGPGNFGRMDAGYINADANLDIVATNHQVPGKFYVLLGNGDGTFQPYSEYSTANQPYDIVLGDFYQDGALDVAVTYDYCCPDITAATIFPGDGNGAFGAGNDIGTCLDPQSISTGDLNADGKLDFITGCPDQKAAVRLGDGNGAFAAKPDLPIFGGQASTAVADVTGDGKLDVVVVCNGFGTHADSVEVFPGNGDGSFGARERFEASPLPRGIAVADLDGDTKLDLVTANEIDSSPFEQLDGSLSVFLNCVPCTPSAISVALSDARAEPGLVKLRWSVPNARDACVVQRRTAGSDWAEMGFAAFESPGMVSYEDRTVTSGERYAYRLFVQSASDQGYSSEVWVLVPREGVAPEALRLDPVYPNPFQTQTHLNFGIPRAGKARLTVFDVAGRHVASLMDREVPSGWRSVAWDGRDRLGRPVPSGTYFAKLESDGQVQVRKVLVAR